MAYHAAIELTIDLCEISRMKRHAQTEIRQVVIEPVTAINRPDLVQ